MVCHRPVSLFLISSKSHHKRRNSEIPNEHARGAAEGTLNPFDFQPNVAHQIDPDLTNPALISAFLAGKISTIPSRYDKNGEAEVLKNVNDSGNVGTDVVAEGEKAGYLGKENVPVASSIGVVGRAVVKPQRVVYKEEAPAAAKIKVAAKTITRETASSNRSLVMQREIVKTESVSKFFAQFVRVPEPKKAEDGPNRPIETFVEEQSPKPFDVAIRIESGQHLENNIEDKISDFTSTKAESIGICLQDVEELDVEGQEDNTIEFTTEYHVEGRDSFAVKENVKVDFNATRGVSAFASSLKSKFGFNAAGLENYQKNISQDAKIVEREAVVLKGISKVRIFSSHQNLFNLP